MTPPARPRTRAGRCGALGAASGALLGALELATLPEPPTAPMTLSVLLLATAIGATLGLASAPIRTSRRLALSLLAPIALWAAVPADGVLERMRQIRPGVGGVVALLDAVALGVGVGVAAWRLTQHRLRAPVREVACFAAGAAALIVALAPLEEHPRLALRIAAVAGAVWIGARVVRGQRPWLSLGLALAAGLLGPSIPFPYADLQAASAALSLALCLIAARRAVPRWIEAATPTPWRVALLAAIGCVAALVLSERIIANGASRWNERPRGAGITAAVISGAQRLTDLDGDGFGEVFGRVDCAPFDASISPGLHEIPGNDVDENCLGGPARADARAWLLETEAVHPPPPSRRGDIVLITVDALRYDDANDPSLPHIQALAASSLAYERAYSTSTMTAQAIPGLLAAKLPTWLRFSFPRPFHAIADRPIPGLGVQLSQGGFGTAFAGGADNDENPLFAATTNLAGFRVIHCNPASDTPDEVVRAAQAAYAELDASGPRLLWVHFMWLHFRSDTRETYRAALRDVDAAIGTLREGLARDAVVAFTADHGEAYGEHGSYHHASTLFEEVVHVPLFLSVPGRPPGRIRAVTSLRSLMPTLSAIARPDIVPPGAGPYLCVEPAACRDMPAPMALELAGQHLHGLILGDRHIIRDVRRGALVAFDLARDPAEITPLEPTPPDLVTALETWEELAFGGDSGTAWPHASRAATVP